MKKAFFVVLILAVAAVVFSCNKKDSPASPGAENTVTATRTADSTATITLTHTNTPSFTITQTATASPTITQTSTPSPILIDNFEDGNLVNAVFCSDCVNNTVYFCMAPCSHILLSGISSQDKTPANGDYYYSITGTATYGGDNDILLLFSTITESASSTGFSAAEMLYFDFDYKLNAPPSMVLDIKIYNQFGAMMSYTLAAANDNLWHSASIPIASFAGTPGDVLPNVYNININTNTVLPSGLSFYEEFSIDNIRFRR